MARHPNQVSVYGPIRTKKDKPIKTPNEKFLDTQEKDLRALEAVQASRPMKPPGRR